LVLRHPEAVLAGALALLERTVNEVPLRADGLAEELRLLRDELVDGLRVDPLVLHPDEDERDDRRSGHEERNDEEQALPRSVFAVVVFVAATARGHLHRTRARCRSPIVFRVLRPRLALCHRPSETTFDPLPVNVIRSPFLPEKRLDPGRSMRFLLSSMQ